MAPTGTPNIIDLTRDLTRAARLGTSAERVDQLLGESMDALGKLVPFDLATVMQLDGRELKVRVARGHLVNPRVERHKLNLNRYPTLESLLQTGQAKTFDANDHQHGDGDAFDGVLDLPHGHACMVIPLKVRSDLLGVMTFDRQTCGTYPDAVVDLAALFGRLLAMAMSYGEQSSLLARLRSQLEEQNRLLSEQVSGRTEACELMQASQSPAMLHLCEQAQQVAATDTPVLITGETGTGKEVLATAVHGWSARAGRPLITINCAALPPNLIESELFGHVKGAFSGADKNRMGRFQAANGGTLFLDEIGELPLDLQAKLLRSLQEGCFEPVGSDKTIRVDVRLIAATNVDLVLAVAERRFRSDLYYRLAVFPTHLPPLRDRRVDIPVIAKNFLTSLARRTGRGPWELDREGTAWLMQQPWEGNVRELINVLERATILSHSPTLRFDTIHPETPLSNHRAATIPFNADSLPQLSTLEEMEREHIRRTMEHTDGRLHGPEGAAALLGLHPNTLRSRMKKLGLGGAKSFRKT